MVGRICSGIPGVVEVGNHLHPVRGAHWRITGRNQQRFVGVGHIAIRFIEHVQWPGNIQRLDTLMNHNRNFSRHHLCAPILCRPSGQAAPSFGLETV